MKTFELLRRESIMMNNVMSNTELKEIEEKVRNIVHERRANLIYQKIF
jgi:hypothetical protein